MKNRHSKTGKHQSSEKIRDPQRVMRSGLHQNPLLVTLTETFAKRQSPCLSRSKVSIIQASPPRSIARLTGLSARADRFSLSASRGERKSEKRYVQSSWTENPRR